jgi:5-methylcytosine-specific restriction endonuclease McrA
MARAVINDYAPCCALPDCNNKVAYHKKYIKDDGTPGAKWKTFCEHHRSVSGKAAVEIFKKSKGGCENRDARLGFVCGDPGTDSLTIDHWDGNRLNTNQDNIVVLCANCHNKKTKLFGDHLTKYVHVNKHFDKLFTFV